MKTPILGVNFDNLTMAEAASKFVNFSLQDEVSVVVTANPEIVMAARKNAEFAAILNSADMVTADGIGVVKASRLLKNKNLRLKERVAGFDLLMELFALPDAKNLKWYFLGGAPGVAAQAANIMQGRFGIEIAGHHHGYFDEVGEDEIIDAIAASGADVVLAGLGFGRQEKWLTKHKNRLNAKVLMGVGGCFDVMSGNLRRAPKIFQKLGIEWLFRLVRQPKRIWRQRILLKFVIVVILEKMRGRL